VVLLLAWALGGLAWTGAGRLNAAEIPILIPQKHPVILEIVDGINKGFEEAGYKGPEFQTVVMDGQGVAANFSTMIDAAVQKQPPLIISITTGLSKLTVDKASDRVPVVFSGVTDPVGAKIVPDLVKHGKVTGASDLWPIEDQLRLIQRVLPKARKVGVIFRPSEANSQFGMRIAREAAKKAGLAPVERGVEDPKEVVAVLEAILPQVDAVYIGPDNMTIEAAKVIVESSAQARKPVFGGEPGTLEKGAVGVVSIQYFDLGRETAKLCAKILKGTHAEDVPVYVAERGFVGLNYDAAARLNLGIAAEVRAAAQKTIGTYREPQEAGGSTSGSAAWWLVGAVVVVLVAVVWRLRSKREKAGGAQE
jgi:putative ABC transport system substrate-binding protein